MLIRRYGATVALLLLAGCSSGFDPGEDLSATGTTGAGTGTVEDGDPLAPCPAAIAPRSGAPFSCIK
jgi:hypothetical protein